MTKRNLRRVSLPIIMLLLLLAICLIAPSQVEIANAAIAGHSDTCDVEMNKYIAKNMPSNYKKIDSAKEVTFDGTREKWQLIRTKSTSQQVFNLAKEIITPDNFVKGSSISLSVGNSYGSSTMQGGYFNIGGGLEASTPLWNVMETKITLDYSMEKANTTTLEQAREVSFTIPNIQTTGTWALQQVITKYDYKLMRFRLQPYYAYRNLFDKNGKVTGVERYIDHYEWRHFSTTTYSTNNSEYFRIRKIA